MAIRKIKRKTKIRKRKKMNKEQTKAFKKMIAENKISDDVLLAFAKGYKEPDTQNGSEDSGTSEEDEDETSSEKQGDIGMPELLKLIKDEVAKGMKNQAPDQPDSLVPKLEKSDKPQYRVLKMK